MNLRIGIDDWIRRYGWWCAAILATSFTVWLHLWRLGDAPGGFYPDEGAIGYNAFSILQTGADEYGVRWPVLFRCFDNYHEPVMVYSLVPMVWLWGLERWVVRLPSAIFHIMAAIAFAWAAYEYTRNRWLSLGSGFFFSILPWAFPVSRVAMSGYTPLLLGICVGCVGLIRAMDRRSIRYAVLAACGWAFAMYAHNCGRPTTAVLLLLFGLFSFRDMIQRWRVLTLFAVALSLLMLPMILFVINTPESMTSRFATLSVWQDSSSWIETTRRVCQRYFEYMGPQFLFLKGDGNLRHMTGTTGVLFLFMAPLLLVGLGRVVRRCRDDMFSRIILIGFITFPVAAILTQDHYHSTRSINGAPYICMLAVAGAYQLWVWRRTARVALSALVLAGCLEAGLFLGDYFGDYPRRAAASFHQSFIETLEWVSREMPEEETLYISGTIFATPVDADFKPFWYEQFLFFRRISPSAYQAGGIPAEIVQPYQGRIERPGYLVRVNPLIVADKEGRLQLLENPELIPSGSTCVKRIPLEANRERFFEVYRVSGSGS